MIACLSITLLRHDIHTTCASYVDLCFIFTIKIKHILRLQLKCQRFCPDKPYLFITCKDEFTHLPLIHQRHHHRYRHAIVRTKRTLFGVHPAIFDIGFKLGCFSYTDHIIVCLHREFCPCFFYHDIVNSICSDLIATTFAKVY